MDIEQEFIICPCCSSWNTLTLEQIKAGDLEILEKICFHCNESFKFTKRYGCEPETNGEMKDRLIRKILKINNNYYTLKELEERINYLLEIENRAELYCKGKLDSRICVKCGWSHK